jgi:hypothetical protein
VAMVAGRADGFLAIRPMPFRLAISRTEPGHE